MTDRAELTVQQRNRFARRLKAVLPHRANERGQQLFMVVDIRLHLANMVFDDRTFLNQQVIQRGALDLYGLAFW